MVATALRSQDVPLEGIRIHAMGGEGNARLVNRQRNADPASTFPSVCILDGDQVANPSEREFTLPGDAGPDAYVFDVVQSHLSINVARLTVALGLPIESQERVVNAIEERGRTNQDRHIIYAQIGGDLGFLPESYVRQAFLNEWANSTSDAEDLVRDLTPALQQAGLLSHASDALAEDTQTHS